jgi:hypothetical protein
LNHRNETKYMFMQTKYIKNIKFQSTNAIFRGGGM